MKFSLVTDFAIGTLIKTCLESGAICLLVFPLKQGDALSPLQFNFALEYAIRKVQKTSLGLDMNSIHQVLANVDDVNVIGDDVRTIERNAGVLIHACKDIGLKTKYIEMGSHWGMIANEYIKIKVKTFKYVGSLVTNRNSIQDEIKCKLKAENSCYYSVQTLLSSRLLSKNL